MGIGKRAAFGAQVIFRLVDAALDVGCDVPVLAVAFRDDIIGSRSQVRHFQVGMVR
ncbi:MAG: hypothetical protein LBS20_11375 [Prevotella sp.]|nr:hypothetical protein [Prevotella sp.]